VAQQTPGCPIHQIDRAIRCSFFIRPIPHCGQRLPIVRKHRHLKLIRLTAADFIRRRNLSFADLLEGTIVVDHHRMIDIISRHKKPEWPTWFIRPLKLRLRIRPGKHSRAKSGINVRTPRIQADYGHSSDVEQLTGFCQILDPLTRQPVFN